MAEFKTHLLVWISSILDHWGSLGTGGIIVLLIQILKESKPKIFNWQFSRRTLLAFLLFAMFQSWQVEYTSRIGREKDLIRSNAENDGLRRDLIVQANRLRDERDMALGDLRADCAAKDAKAQTLEKQNRDQQASINGCLSKAIDLIPKPEPFRQTILTMEQFQDNKNTSTRISRFLLLTNKSVSPLIMGAYCNGSIADLRVSIVGSGFITSAATKADAQNYRIDVATPAWTPTSPLLISVEHYDKNNDIICTFNPNQ